MSCVPGIFIPVKYTFRQSLSSLGVSFPSKQVNIVYILTDEHMRSLDPFGRKDVMYNLLWDHVKLIQESQTSFIQIVLL